MPSLAEHHSSKFVKIMYIGDSSTGKTGSLASLVADGYTLRVLDCDNGLDSLKQYAPPDKLGNVGYETLRDDYVASPQGPKVSSPKAFIAGLKLLEEWTDGTDPAEWGENFIFVIDSLTAFSRSAFEWARGMAPSAKDPRQWYSGAQMAIENTIAKLTSEKFHCNVVIISHINWKELQDGTIRGYPSTIGSALGPSIPRYFNTLVLAETSGFGKSMKRKVKTVSTGSIDLKVPTPKIESELPLETGLSTIFKTLKGK